MSIYLTTFYKIPYSSTEQERNDYDLLFCQRLGIKNGEENPIDNLTTAYSIFKPHSTDLTNNGYIYAIDGSFKKYIEGLTNKNYSDITTLEKVDFLPTNNFPTAIDDDEYSYQQIKGLGWFSELLDT